MEGQIRHISGLDAALGSQLGLDHHSKWLWSGQAFKAAPAPKLLVYCWSQLNLTSSYTRLRGPYPPSLPPTLLEFWGPRENSAVKVSPPHSLRSPLIPFPPPTSPSSPPPRSLPPPFSGRKERDGWTNDSCFSFLFKKVAQDVIIPSERCKLSLKASLSSGSLQKL